MVVFVSSVICAQSSNNNFSSEPPVIPVGTDAYLLWDKLPYQRIGVRSYMRCTYDRQGNNRSSDASHFLYQESDTFNVALDVKGNGILYFKRTNHFHGSPWHYEIDNEDFIVKETSTDAPIDAKKKYKNVTFIPEELFPSPLTETWAVTKGSDLMWVPLSFENSLRIAYSRTFYATGYYIYHVFSPGIKHISKPITSWEKTPPEPKVLELINKSGTDIAPKGRGIKRIPEKFIYLLTLTKADLSDVKLSDYKGQKVVLNIFPSLDTSVCATSIRTFNKEAASLDNTVVLSISRDLPFAHGRFCSTEGIDKAIPASEFKNDDFGKAYGIRIIDGPMEGLFARSVVVLDENGTVKYTELVPEITQEPDYKKALDSL